MTARACAFDRSRLGTHPSFRLEMADHTPFTEAQRSEFVEQFGERFPQELYAEMVSPRSGGEYLSRRYGICSLAAASEPDRSAWSPRMRELDEAVRRMRTLVDAQWTRALSAFRSERSKTLITLSNTRATLLELLIALERPMFAEQRLQRILTRRPLPEAGQVFRVPPRHEPTTACVLRDREEYARLAATITSAVNEMNRTIHCAAAAEAEATVRRHAAGVHPLPHHPRTSLRFDVRASCHLCELLAKSLWQTDNELSQLSANQRSGKRRT